MKRNRSVMVVSLLLTIGIGIGLSLSSLNLIVPATHAAGGGCDRS